MAPPSPLTANVQVVFGHDAAHGAGGRADVGAAVALVEEGEDEDAVGAELQRRVAALLLPQELLGAAGWEGRGGSGTSVAPPQHPGGRGRLGSDRGWWGFAAVLCGVHGITLL